MNLLQALISRPRSFEGSGRNHEGEAFGGRLDIELLVGGKAVMLRYVATGKGGAVLHTEATLLAPAQNGEPCLWPVMAELPFLLPHPQISCVAKPDGSLTALFASGPREDPRRFREEISIELMARSELIYSHAWGMPGGSFQTRSSCVFFPAA
jgi:hypothetical protein